MDYNEFATRDLRLVLLRSLAAAHAYTANETVLQMEAMAFGHKRTRDVIRTELKFLKDIGAVKLQMQDPLMVAELTRRGHDHVEGLAELEGVNTPSPRG